MPPGIKPCRLINLADVLTKWRKMSDLTQSDAAKRIGIDDSVYADLEGAKGSSANTLATTLKWLMETDG